MGSDVGRFLFRRVGLVVLCLACVRLQAQTDTRHEIELHYQRAQEALQAKQDAVAAQEFREILRVDPRNAQAHANLGVIAFTQKNYAQAAQEFRTALKLQPSLWNAQALLGMSKIRSGDHRDAKPLLEESFRHVQDAKLRSQAGLDLITLYYESKDLDRVADIVRVLARSSPDDPVILYTAYRAYSDLAAHSLAALAQVAPESAQMHEILAQALASQDDFPGAIAQYRRALQINPQLTEIHCELGQMILANSPTESGRQLAEKEFAAALVADPANANCEYMLGEVEWLRSRPQEALQHYTQALDIHPDFVDAEIAAGKALTALGQPAQALVHLEEAIRSDPQNEVAHYRLAQAYRKLGRNSEAERESAAFRRLRDSHAPVRSLYEQIQQRPTSQQSIDPNEPQ